MAMAEDVDLHAVVEPMVRAGLNFRAMADALALSASSAELHVLSLRRGLVDPPALGLVGKTAGQ